MSRVVRGEYADDAFDLEFWNKVGPEKRLEVMWDMVLELAKWKPNYVVQSRLARNIAVVKRGRR